MHIPVLQKEVLKYLNPKPGENFVDCTIGSAGHALKILEKNAPEGKILGIDLDFQLIEKLRRLNIKRLIAVCDNYKNLKKIVEKLKFRPIHGILLDLGICSWHLEESGRGFSFLKDENLDMRYDIFQDLTAEQILNQWSFEKIEKILREYGEEKFSEKIAREIIKQRKLKPIKTTFQLVKIIEQAIPRWYCQRKIPRTRAFGAVRGRHFATKTFQALRIAVNSEISNLETVLPQALEVLSPKGRLVAISFHSLEDRIVKNFLREKSREGLLKILTKKPISPTLKEIKLNPRSRSAKLRAAVKI